MPKLTLTDKTALDSELILDHLSTAVILTDSYCRVLRVNQAAEQILEISEKRAVGQLLSRVVRISDPDRRAIENSIEERRPITKRQSRIINSRRLEVTVDFTVSPIEIQGRDLVLIEFNELDRLLRINREEAQMANYDTTRQLVRGFAHEIKNPLGGLRGAAQLLHQELDDEGLREYTDVITKEADRLRNLVDRMLGPNSPLTFAPVNIHEVLERVVLLIQAEAGGKITFTKDYDPSLPEIFGDLEQLIQALLNIARNAMEALLESTTENPSILLRTRAQHRFTIGTTQHALVCRIDIIDNGPGIPPAISDDIFFPMISGRSAGTGLGLPIAQSIINNHHGLVEYESEPGNTEFSIFLPTNPADTRSR